MRGIKEKQIQFEKQQQQQQQPTIFMLYLSICGSIRVASRSQQNTFLTSLLGPFAKLRQANTSFVMSVLPSRWNLGSYWKDFVKSDILVFFFFENLSTKFEFH